MSYNFVAYSLCNTVAYIASYAILQSYIYIQYIPTILYTYICDSCAVIIDIAYEGNTRHT